MRTRIITPWAIVFCRVSWLYLMVPDTTFELFFPKFLTALEAEFMYIICQYFFIIYKNIFKEFINKIEIFLFKGYELFNLNDEIIYCKKRLYFIKNGMVTICDRIC